MRPRRRCRARGSRVSRGGTSTRARSRGPVTTGSRSLRWWRQGGDSRSGRVPSAARRNEADSARCLDRTGADPSGRLRRRVYVVAVGPESQELIDELGQHVGVPTAPGSMDRARRSHVSFHVGVQSTPPGASSNPPCHARNCESPGPHVPKYDSFRNGRRRTKGNAGSWRDACEIHSDCQQVSDPATDAKFAVAWGWNSTTKIVPLPKHGSRILAAGKGA
jgi:hypothetical protein